MQPQGIKPQPREQHADPIPKAILNSVLEVEYKIEERDPQYWEYLLHVPLGLFLEMLSCSVCSI